MGNSVLTILQMRGWAQRGRRTCPARLILRSSTSKIQLCHDGPPTLVQRTPLLSVCAEQDPSPPYQSVTKSRRGQTKVSQPLQSSGGESALPQPGWSPCSNTQPIMGQPGFCSPTHPHASPPSARCCPDMGQPRELLRNLRREANGQSAADTFDLPLPQCCGI